MAPRMLRVPLVETRETTDGPIAIDGRTITLVHRTKSVAVGRGPRRTRVARSRPAYIEVLDAQGARHVVRIRDVERALLMMSAALGAAVTVWRAFRR